MNAIKRGVVAVAVLLLGPTSIPEARAMDAQSLDARQRSIVPIAAFTASGETDRLKPALQSGLDAGLTVNEIKEILVQLYAYAGFPRSLNGLSAFSTVLDERKARGIADEVGRDASPIPPDLDRDAFGAKVRAQLSGQTEIPPPAPWQTFSPVADTFLKEHLFADIFARDVLDFAARELATVAALANMTGTAGQLRFYLGAAMNAGLSAAQMQDFVAVLKAQVGSSQGDAAGKLLAEVLKTR